MVNLEELYRKQYNIQVSVIQRHVRCRDTAEDIVMEAYARSYKYVSSFDEKRSSIQTWFNRIMFNVLRDHKRRDKGQIQDELTDEVSVGDPMFERTDENLNLIQKEIDKLSNEDTRFVLRLFFILGYRTDEIIKLINVTQTQITSACYRFKKKLSTKYEDLL